MAAKELEIMATAVFLVGLLYAYVAYRLRLPKED